MTAAKRKPIDQGLILDGHSLTVDDFVRAARDPAVRVSCEAASLERVRQGRKRIDAITAEYAAAYSRYRESGQQKDRPKLTYGVTSGFGEFKRIAIPPEELVALQKNILLSHAVGIGDNADEDDPVNYFFAEVVRAALILRLNAFLKGHSGIRAELCACIEAMLNAGIVPLVPTRGSVGSSGDLCPLAHLFGVLVGAGRFYVVRSNEDMPRRARPTLPAASISEHLAGAVVQPAAKEGIALTNGTTFSTALLALAVSDAERLAQTVDISAALSLEAACGCSRAFDPKVHDARGQVGQAAAAANIRGLIAGSSLIDQSEDVQDVYSLRCAPQVHGASRDAIAYARAIVSRELNAATDNPLFFPDADPDDAGYSAGNFHGQPIGMAADFLTIAVAELANISERRTQMLLDKDHNRNLPPNLVAARGVNSGYMLAQYAAASLVSENKVLSHPASVDSIPTSANIEDHVAMATHACRKAISVVANVQAVIAIELLVACQAIDWRVGMARPATSSPSTASPADESAQFEQQCRPSEHSRIASALGQGSRRAYLAIRQVVQPAIRDREFGPDIWAVRRLVAGGDLLAD